MSKIDDLIEKLCPNGVEYKPIWSLTAWDKKFNGVDKEKQKNVISYKYYLSTDFAKVEKKNGNIKYISTGISGDDRYTTEELAGDYLAEGEVVCIPWGGTPNVKYHKGKFVTGDNRIATSLDINILSNKFLYYWMQSKINVISKFYRGSGIKHPSMKDVLDMNIAVPPLEVQCEIVHILDDFTLLSAELSAELKARQKQYEYYLYKLISDSKKITKNKLYELTIWDKKFNAVENYMQPNVKKYPTLLAVDLFNLERENGNVFLLSTGGQRGWTTEEVAGDNISEGEVVTIPWGKSRPVQEVMKYYCGKFVTGDNRIATSNDIKKLNNKYLFYWMQTQSERIDKFYRGSGIQHPNMRNVLTLEIELPSIDEQKRIVSILDKFEKLCNDISKGLPAEIEARQKQYEYYRDKLLTFKELKVNE